MRRKALDARETVDTRITAENEEGGFEEAPWIRHAVRQIQAGRDEDQVQFGLIYQHFEPKCVGLLRKLGLQRDVDDLAQEIMWQVHQGIGDYRLESSFATWVFGIVKNAALNAHRDRNTKKVKATEASLDDLLDADSARGRALPEPRDVAPDPLEKTLASERQQKLEALLRELPPKMRFAMLLFYRHGFKQAEIADLQGTSVHTVKKQLVEGRKRLRPMTSALAELFTLLLGVFFVV